MVFAVWKDHVWSLVLASKTQVSIETWACLWSSICVPLLRDRWVCHWVGLDRARLSVSALSISDPLCQLYSLHLIVTFVVDRFSSLLFGFLSQSSSCWRSPLLRWLWFLLSSSRWTHADSRGIWAGRLACFLSSCSRRSTAASFLSADPCRCQLYAQLSW